MGQSIRVLHVDDQPDFAAVAAEFLELEDDRFDVLTATSAAEGLEVLDERDVDCVISDYEMPGQNGIEFLETVRETYADLPFILFTGKGSEEIASGAISAGVSDYLQKQSGTEQYTLLANRIRNAVDAYQAEQAAIRAKDQLRQIIDLIPDGIFAKNEDLEYILVNETFASAFGMEPEEIVSKTDFEFLPEERAKAFREKDREILERGESELVYEGAFIRADGTRQFHQTTKIPFEIAGTDERAVLGYGRNVTDIKEYEQELERANERLRQVASMASQDMRELLDALSGALDAAVEPSAQADVGPCREIVTEMEALTRTVDEMIEDVDAVVDASDVELRRAAETAWETLETADATLHVETDRTIRADESRLQLFFENLFQNAIAHGGDSVSVTVGPADGGFFVADDGPGIPPNARATVFEAGYSTGDGAGLGLSLVERVVHAHGWELALEGDIDDGTRFEVTGVEFRD